ncbi:MAG TPA: GAF domain-containing protein [Thermoanaerobaculia bacterium]|nr:GAF domain-containing protein [Thermoanaerobaculia bacterium]
MIPATAPQNEPERLGALREYEILDTEAEEKFDDLTLLARHICDTPIALISFVDADRQWFKSRIGLTTSQTPRAVSFCGHAILEEDVMVVPDTAADERFADNPMVTGAPGIRFYAGAPLLTSTGYALGTLCVIDRKPRELTAEQLDALRALARQVVAQLELRRRLERERQEAKEAIDERDTTLQLIVSQMPAVLWSTDTNLRLTSSEGAGLTGLGVKPGQFVGVTLFDFFRTTDPEFLPLVAHRKALLGESVSFEVDWSGRTYASHCEPLRNPDNSIRGVIGIALDITRQKRSERELQKSFSLLRATLDSAAEGILVVDERGKISNFNASFVHMWRVPEEIAATRDEDRLLAFLLDSVEDSGDFAKKVMGLHSKRDVETSGTVKLKDGRVLQRFSRPQKVDGRTVGTVLSFQEIEGSKIEGSATGA